MQPAYQRQNWITKGYVTVRRSITQGSRIRGEKFSKICGEKRGWHLKPSHFVAVEGIFLVSSVFKEKMNFWKYLGMYKVFGGCSVKEKRQGNNAYIQQNRKSNVQATLNPFPRQSLAHAQTPVRSVHAACSLTTIIILHTWDCIWVCICGLRALACVTVTVPAGLDPGGTAQ